MFKLLSRLVADLKQVKLDELSGEQNVKADCTIIMKDEDFVGLATGTANPQQVRYSNTSLNRD